MRARRFAWDGAAAVASEIREWVAESAPEVDVEPIGRAVRERGDAAVLELEARFGTPPAALRVELELAERELAELDPAIREAMKVASENIREVAHSQLREPVVVELPQGQSVSVAEVAVAAAGIYAPGGRAAYPSTVLMCCIPARAAGVGRLVLATPPGEDGLPHPSVLAAAALCGVDEIYAMGGAQAIFALAHGTESVVPVDLIAGPGNSWVQEAKRAVFGDVGIDSLAGPSELMLVADSDVKVEAAALDLCAQAEHGADSPLVAVAAEDAVLDDLLKAVEQLAAERPSVSDAPLALVAVPGPDDAIELANAFAPEHLQLMSREAAALAPMVRTAGCVFVGESAGTAFGDYAAGSNHVLPTGGTGRFSGPLGPGTFRRRISNVSLPAPAAAALAPHVDALARAEGLPVHGESARARS